MISFNLITLAIFILCVIVIYMVASWMFSDPGHFRKRNQRRIDSVKRLFKRK